MNYMGKSIYSIISNLIETTKALYFLACAMYTSVPITGFTSGEKKRSTRQLYLIDYDALKKRLLRWRKSVVITPQLSPTAVVTELSKISKKSFTNIC